MVQHDLNLALLRTFVAVIETGSLTAAGRLVGRTQPAITHQLRRLETAVGKRLLSTDNRRLTLTSDGEVLLQYARSMLRLNEEAMVRLSTPSVEGRVVLGIPDLYVANLLPDALGIFARALPSVEIELRCMRSVFLVEALERGELDLALVTRQSPQQAGETLRKEPLIWVGGPTGHPERNAPLPLALLRGTGIYREHCLEALAQAGHPWRIVSISDSILGLSAVVYSGLAVSVFPRSAISAEMRRLGRSHGLPDLADVEIVLMRGTTKEQPEAIERLADFIRNQLQDHATAPPAQAGGPPGASPEFGETGTGAPANGDASRV